MSNEPKAIGTDKASQDAAEIDERELDREEVNGLPARGTITREVWNEAASFGPLRAEEIAERLRARGINTTGASITTMLSKLAKRGLLARKGSSGYGLV